MARAPRKYKDKPYRDGRNRSAHQFQLEIQFVRRIARGNQRQDDSCEHHEKPRPLAIHTPSLPPGISTAWEFSQRSGRLASLIAAAYIYMKRNEVKNDRGVNEELIRAAHGFVEPDLAAAPRRKRGLHDDGDVGSFPARVNFPERRGKIAVDSHYEWHARDSRDSAAHSAGVSY